MRGTFFGRYELVRKVAAGGMAELFLARQWGEGGFVREVVIKRLFRHMAERERLLRMFQDEARLLAELSHPNIPQVYDLGFADAHWYMTMEYVDGFTVADLWRIGARANQIMPLSVAVGIVMQACDALHHAHERRDKEGRALRIVHRDVTPHNVMLTRDGVVKMLDFGVAQTAARRDTEAGVVKGTFSYMAPEQVRARALDKRADVFALGVILYELTTGTRLYRGNDVAVMTSIVEKDAPAPSTRVSGYHPELEAIVVGALQRDRARRTPSAAHLCLSLEDFAVRHGMLVAPRAIGRYAQQIFPAERAREDGMGIVQGDLPDLPDYAPPSRPPPPPHSGSAEVIVPARGVTIDDVGAGWARDTRESALPDLDDSGLLEDLDFLSSKPPLSDLEPPPEIPRGLTLPGRSDVPDPLGEMPALPGPDALEDQTIDSSAGIDRGAWDDETARARRNPRAGSARAIAEESSASGSDLLDLDVFEDDSQKPVVLLGQPKRPGRSPKEEGDYVRDLLRRLEEEGE